MGKVAIDTYENSYYNPGGGPLKRFLWYVINALFVNSPLIPISRVKVFLLRMFGATIGENVNIKPSVNIKYPWHLIVGDHVWIGEGVWIDSLATIRIASHVVLSQGAMLLTGNHDYKKTSFDLLVSPIVLEEGVWIGAKAVVCPGVRCNTHSVLMVASVATRNLESYTIYQGNPAVEVKKRIITAPQEIQSTTHKN